MKKRPLSGRSVVTRTSRRDPRGAKLESIAAEFALMAQRRARIARQIDLLGRQLDAAAASLCGVQSRMGLLAQRMHQIDPDLARDYDIRPRSSGHPLLTPTTPTMQTSETQVPPGAPVNRYAVPQRANQQTPAQANDAMPRNTAPPNPAPIHRPMRHVQRRRPFLPD
jgi:hypothetical protein